MKKTIRTFNVDADVAQAMCAFSDKFNRSQSEIFNTFMRTALGKLGYLTTPSDELEEIAKIGFSDSELEKEFDLLECFLKMFRAPIGKEKCQYITTTELANELSAQFQLLKFTVPMLGRVIKAAGFKRKSVRRTPYEKVMAYMLVRV